MSDLIFDLFAGPGGWSEALRQLGRSDVGVELDPAACSTRAAAGHRTVRADIRAFPVTALPYCQGVIASPPCPSFSTAGKQAAMVIRAELVAAVNDAFEGRPTGHHEAWLTETLYASKFADTDRAWCEGQAREALLSVEPVRWLLELNPEWVAFEQVPAVLPLWRAYALQLSRRGYSTWAGLLNAADFGVPQTRTRAFLLASRARPVHPPDPTHCRGGASTLLGELEPWVSMAEALGWTGEDLPARTLAGNRQPRWLYPDHDGTHGRIVLEERQEKAAFPRSLSGPAMTLTAAADNGNFRFVLNMGRDWQPGGSRDDAQQIDGAEPAPTVTSKAGGQWFFDRPATTLQGGPRVFSPGGHITNDGRDNSRMVGRSQNALPLRLEQMLALQSFRPDYPVQGNKSQRFAQIGNAVPPLLAEAVLRQVL